MEAFLLIYLVIVVGFVGLVLGLTAVLGKLSRPSSPAKFMPYESGMRPITGARLRIPIQYQRIAMLFLIFDIVAAFIYPWALSYKLLGAAALGAMFFFIGILLLGYLYAWKRGAFLWE